MDIKIVYEDGYEYTDSVESTEPINPQDPWGHPDVDSVSLQADMDYAEHMGWAEDGDDRYEFDSIARADEDKKALWVNGELIWKSKSTL